jgi:hypothetical protein
MYGWRWSIQTPNPIADDVQIVVVLERDEWQAGHSGSWLP